MPIENVTANRGYELPAGANNLIDDVDRLIAAINAIDVDVADLLVALAAKAGLVSPIFTGTPQAPTAVLGTNSAQIATTAFVQAAAAALVDSAPGTLDTLNELAAALGDDPNFATTVANALALRLRFDASQTLNDTQKLQGINNLGLFDRFARYDAAQTISDAGKRVLLGNVSAALLSGYLSPGGLTLSNAADADHDITVAPGSAGSDDADVSAVLMRLAAARTKQADATFAEGNNAGGMISGNTLPTSGTVHVWLIMKADGTVDVCFSTSLSPTLPTGFVYKRRIGSLRTDASANIRNFVQVGDEFILLAPVQDSTTTGLGTTAVLFACTVPVGFPVVVIGSGFTYHPSSSNVGVNLTCPDQTDASVTGLHLVFNSPVVNIPASFGINRIRTNSNGQLRVRSASASTGFTWNTFGWVDTRGRLA